jgi:hypothetical protein
MHVRATFEQCAVLITALIFTLVTNLRDAVDTEKRFALI